MTTCSPRSRRFSRCLLLFVLVAFLGATGCSQLPRAHWWQFWRKKPTTTSSIYPDSAMVPPPPDMANANPNGVSLAPGAQGTPPGGVIDNDPMRQPAASIAELRTVHFSYDSDQISGENQQILEANAAWLKANPGIKIQIQGHCDERGTTEYNLALGDRRAKSVKAYLMQRGIDGERLYTTSFGKERPVNPARNDAAFAQNRRAQFLVY